MNRSPPSPLTAIPRRSRWARIAPHIVTIARTAPKRRVIGKSRSPAATNSTTPEAYLPQGSIPIVLKIQTDSADEVNLKNSDCKKMMEHKYATMVSIFFTI